MYIGTGYIQVLYLGRAPRTKETLPDFHEWHRVTRHPLVFRGLTGSQRTPGNWGITISVNTDILVIRFYGNIENIGKISVNIFTKISVRLNFFIF